MAKIGRPRNPGTDEERREAKLARMREWSRNNRERVRARRAANGDKVREQQRAAAARNRAKPERQQYMRDYYEARYAAEPERYRAAWAAYRARKVQATPAWADPVAIAAVYRLAAEATELTGVEHEVDHVIPLKGRNVCGLHVETNLQVIPKADNRQKGNRHVQ